MTEALQLWKNLAGKGDEAPEDQKASSNGRHIVFIFVHVNFLFSKKSFRIIVSFLVIFEIKRIANPLRRQKRKT